MQQFSMVPKGDIMKKMKTKSIIVHVSDKFLDFRRKNKVHEESFDEIKNLNTYKINDILIQI